MVRHEGCVFPTDGSVADGKPVKKKRTRPRRTTATATANREAVHPAWVRGTKARLRVLITRAAIQKRIRHIARQIARDFHGERVHLVGVLKGACIFLSDLIREMPLETSMDFMAVASYGKGTESSGQVRLIKDLDASIAGLNVIVVEDILDTGLTLDYLLRVLSQRRPKTLRVAALLDKPSRRIKSVRADYCGFPIPNEFVVGYGLDYAERYRNLRDVCVLTLPEKGESQPSR
jgi:hypoxanthine phosphoribosyltransferase